MPIITTPVTIAINPVIEYPALLKKLIISLLIFLFLPRFWYIVLYNHQNLE